MNATDAHFAPDSSGPELLDLRVPDLPPRSRLYHLEPVGVGTPAVESLTGYCARLALAHNLRVGTLLGRIVNPSLAASPSGESPSGERRPDWETTHFHLINGVGDLAADFCAAVHRLTLRPELRRLTLLPWAALFPSAKKLLRPRRAWCPDCLAERRTARLPIYEPLLWTLALAEVCLRHGSPLRGRCPRCDSTMKVLTGATRPGHCSNCDRWLGSSGQIQAQNLIQDANWPVWCSTVLGDMVAADPSQVQDLARPSQFFAAVRFWSARAGMRSAADLADAVQCHKTTAREWLTGTNLPEIDHFLRLLDAFGLGAVEFLLCRAPVAPENRLAAAAPRRSRAKKWTRRPFGAEAVRATLQAAVDDVSSPPPTVRGFCRLHRYVPSMVYQHLPQLCAALAAKGAAHRAAGKVARMAARVRDVCQAVEDVRAAGLPLTQANLLSRLPKPGILRDPKIKAALESALTEFSGR